MQPPSMPRYHYEPCRNRSCHPTTRDLKAALVRIETLWGAKPGTSEGDELDVLADLVEAYENRHHSIGPVSGLQALKHLMQANDLTQSDLPEIGSQGVVSEILTGKRDLNVRHIRALAKRFGVSTAVFV
jgi:antitoxin component HigA of HigAB toxin-antitoxin module